MALVTGVRVVPMILSGLLGGYVYNNGTDFTRYFRDLSYFMEIGRNSSDGLQKSSGSSHNPVVEQQLGLLSAKIDTLANSQKNPGTVMVVAGGSSGGGLVTTGLYVVAGGGLGYVLLRWSGWKITDVFWVSRSAFKAGLTQVASGMDSLSSRLAKVRRALSERIELLTSRQQECIAQQEAMALTLENVGDDVSSVRGDVSVMHLSVRSIEGKVDSLESKLDVLRSKQDYANRGIQMLCDVVSHHFLPGPTSSSSRVQRLREFAGLDPLPASGSKLALTSEENEAVDDESRAAEDEDSVRFEDSEWDESGFSQFSWRSLSFFGRSASTPSITVNSNEGDALIESAQGVHTDDTLEGPGRVRTLG